MKAVRLLKAYLKKSIKQDEDFELLDPILLNEMLTHIYISACNHDGQHYTATSFKNIKDALNNR